jgi:flagellar hook assembly protein FlgD
MEEPMADLYDLHIFPNPFRQSATIEFSTKNPGHIRIGITDMDGKTVKILLDDRIAAGNHSFTWDGMDLTSSQVKPGVYFIRFFIEDRAIEKKIVKLLKE